MWEFVLERANYWAIIGLMMVGLYIVFRSENLIKRMVGLSVFQTSICLFYVTLGKVAGGTAPVLSGRMRPRARRMPRLRRAMRCSQPRRPGRQTSCMSIPIPLPHVLMLTAIVVGVATLSVGPGARGAHPGSLWHDRGRMKSRSMDIEVARLEAAAEARGQTGEAQA